jgi:hypothetical protein
MVDAAYRANLGGACFVLVLALGTFSKRGAYLVARYTSLVPRELWEGSNVRSEGRMVVPDVVGARPVGPGACGARWIRLDAYGARQVEPDAPGARLGDGHDELRTSPAARTTLGALEQVFRPIDAIYDGGR